MSEDNRNKDFINEKSDLFLKYLAMEARDEMLSELDEYRNIPPVDFPADFEAKILAIPEIQDAEQGADVAHEKISRYNFRRISKIAAIFLVVLIAGFATAMVSVEAVREQVYSFFFKSGDEFSTTKSLDDLDAHPESPEAVIRDWHGYYYPEYLPKGFYLVDARDSQTKKELVFESNDLSQIYIIEENLETTTFYNDKKSDSNTHILINGTPAYIQLKEYRIALKWQAGDSSLTVHGDNITSSEAIKIAEQIKYIK